MLQFQNRSKITFYFFLQFIVSCIIIFSLFCLLVWLLFSSYYYSLNWMPCFYHPWAIVVQFNCFLLWIFVFIFFFFQLLSFKIEWATIEDIYKKLHWTWIYWFYIIIFFFAFFLVIYVQFRICGFFSNWILLLNWHALLRSLLYRFIGSARE